MNDPRSAPTAPAPPTEPRPNESASADTAAAPVTSPLTNGATKPTRLDLFVVYGLSRASGTSERVAALGVDLEEARKVGESAMRRLFGDRSQLTPAALVQFFGKPTIRRVERLAWNLALWPEHHFEIFIRDSGVDGGEVVMRERDPEILAAVPPGSLAEAQALFRPWHHTRRDVARVLGDTVYDGGAYPLEQHEWELKDGSFIACDFAHGLLLEVRGAAPRPKASEKRPWWKFWGGNG
jgi:hypothetical protein